MRISPVIIANKSFRKDNEKLNNKEGVPENGRFQSSKLEELAF